jgi:GT2 family glycosyltransferase
VPAGRHPASLQFLDDDGAWHEAIALTLQVPWLTWPAWLPGGQPSDLVAFQLAVCPAHPPRTVVPERFPSRRRPARSRPGLAIVTPSFNQVRFLEQTIASVASAVGIAVDHVVQDGSSTDGSVDVLRRCAAGARSSKPADSGVRFRWESAPDAGQADAIAKGFAKTTGAPDDLMTWINSDDYYLPGALPFVADWFAQHPTVDVVYGNRIVIDEEGLEIGRWYLPRHDDDLLRLNDFVPQETLFWRRRIWDHAGGVDPSLKFAVDWDLLLRFLAAGARIVHVPYFLACFRVHRAQKTSAQMKSVGQQEIDRLRERTFGRRLSFAEVETHPRLLSYLRRSAFVELLSKFGIRTH